MKHLLFSLLLIATAPAFAQQGNPPQQKTEQRQAQTPEQKATSTAKHMEKTLGLSADQKTKVYDIALLRAQKMDGLKNKPTTDKTERHAEMKSIQTAFDDKLKSILTPEQFSKWQDQKHHNQTAPAAPAEK
jgi:protein CpxP